ncbi:FAD-binding protein [Pseudarthrobacter sulfonivorans]|uniref:FAD-binding protein n=1 Tax=Pseudarthrobacter sulfonivorans TaxID=121292 RepID=UPI003D33E186
MQGVRFARAQQLPLSIHGGGHSGSGASVCEGGLMLDLSRMKGIQVDPARGVAQAQTGLLLRELDHEDLYWALSGGGVTRRGHVTHVSPSSGKQCARRRTDLPARESPGSAALLLRIFERCAG